jgi:hypothetical protein
MEKKCQVIIMHSDKGEGGVKKGQIYISTDEGEDTKGTLHISLRDYTRYQNYNKTGQDLYILSDDEIKFEDWVIDEDIDKPVQTSEILLNNLNNFPHLKPTVKKIIATTDKSLDLPKIPDAFIEEYCKIYRKCFSGNIHDVLVEYEEILTPVLYEGRMWNDKKGRDPNGEREFYMKVTGFKPKIRNNTIFIQNML